MKPSEIDGKFDPMKSFFYSNTYTIFNPNKMYIECRMLNYIHVTLSHCHIVGLKRRNIGSSDNRLR